MSDPFNKNDYFKSLIAQLRADGAFATYAKLKGNPHPDWPADAKQIHFNDEDGVGRNIPGTSAHLGDEPYKPVTRDFMQNPDAAYRPNARDVALKVQVIRDALKAFMPEDGFRAYLQDFTEHLERPGNKAAYEQALKNMRPTLRREFKMSTSEFESVMLDVDGPRDNMRVATTSSAALKNLDHYPQLVTSLAIYQAAHARYLDDLRNAVTHTYDMDEDERDNAMAALNSNSMEQLRDFVIFGNYMPLVIYAYENPDRARAIGCPRHAGTEIQGGVQSAESWKVPLDHGRMSEAIGTAWDIFFAQGLLKNRFLQPEVPVNEICPANKHLQHAKDSGALQEIYSRVIAQDGKLQPFVDLARTAAADLTASRSNPPPR